MARPAQRVYSLEELADLLALPAALVLRHLRAPGASFFPGAWLEGEEWRIPEAAARAFMGRKVERLYSLVSVAEIFELSYDHVWRTLRGQCVEVAGAKRVPESVVAGMVERRRA